MRNIKLTIEYDGTNYSGWQVQKNRKTIQEEIEKALEKILKQKVSVTSSGRTDAGVHALGQVANFKTDKTISTEELLCAMNTILPSDIVILLIEEVDDEFNARLTAKKKHYRYVINNSRFPSALNVNREYHFKYELDIAKMQNAAKDLIGKKDFRAFMAAGSTVTDTVREVYSVNITRLGNRVIVDIVGNGFLYNMVRIIVGTLLEISTGRLEENTIKTMIQTLDRTKGGKTVGPEGLYLVSVEY